MKILIIGIEGFVGWHFVNLMKKTKEFVVYGTYLKKPDNISDVILYKQDITNEHSLNKLINEIKPNVIVHLAAQSSVSTSWKDPILTVNVNIIGVINVLNAVKKYSSKTRVLLVGSSEEYGKVSIEDYPINELCNTYPSNIYAVTKLTQSHLGRIYHEAYGLDIIMTRSFNHFGPYQSSNFVISDFCKQIAEMEIHPKKNKCLKVGNLNVSRDFTDVRDIVEAYLLLIENGTAGEIYNVGSGEGRNLNKMLEIILSKSPLDPKIVIDQDKYRPIDVPEVYADISKLKSATNWSPSYSLEETIEDTLNYWRSKLKFTKGK